MPIDMPPGTVPSVAEALKLYMDHDRMVMRVRYPGGLVPHSALDRLAIAAVATGAEHNGIRLVGLEDLGRTPHLQQLKLREAAARRLIAWIFDRDA